MALADILGAATSHTGETSPDLRHTAGNTTQNTLKITLTPVNDTAVLATGSALAYVENGAAAVINTGITVSDVDNTTLAAATVTVKDSNGNLLNEGDSVQIIKDLKVKGSSSVLKRGTMVKNIRLTDDDAAIEGRVEKVMMVLKTEFLKKV